MLLGCIGDDFTGSTDLANMLVRGGMRTLQTIGVPATPLTEDVDACVVALKSSTSHAAEAVAESLAALNWLRAQGCPRFYFKYCSTFDSTPRGNIGPVAESLMVRLDAPLTLACPAFPTNGRTVFQGHLFVGNTLLSDSPMKDSRWPLSVGLPKQRKSAKQTIGGPGGERLDDRTTGATGTRDDRRQSESRRRMPSSAARHCSAASHAPGSSQSTR
jgi:hypothetical protein